MGSNKSTIKCYMCSEMAITSQKCPKNKSKKATAKHFEKEQDTLCMTVEGGVIHEMIYGLLTPLPQHILQIARLPYMTLKTFMSQ